MSKLRKIIIVISTFSTIILTLFLIYILNKSDNNNNNVTKQNFFTVNYVTDNNKIQLFSLKSNITEYKNLQLDNTLKVSKLLIESNMENIDNILIILEKSGEIIDRINIEPENNIFEYDLSKYENVQNC